MTARAVEPIRRDVYVYNEATGFLITSRAMGGRGIEPDDAAWTDAVQEGTLLPIELVQDDPFLIRVVVGDELTAQESEEWVGRLPLTLRVADGRLAITGGIDFVVELLGEDLGEGSEYVRVLEIPPGDYRAALYAYLSGVNGEYLLDLAAPAEPAGAYFRRTRPGEPFPLWLRHWCVAYPDKDPDHEDEWEGQPVPHESPECLDFLLHLTPLDGPADPMPPLEGGFFSVLAFETRKPARCPLGLDARDVLRPQKRTAPPAPVETVDVQALVSSHRLTPVDGGPVELDVAHLVRAYRLAWFATDSAVPELRIALPGAAPWAPTLEGLEECAAASDVGGSVRIGFTGSGGKWTTLGWLDTLGLQLASLPDGSIVELMTAEPEREGDPLVGRLRFRGSVVAGTWRIAQSFPPVSAARLREALDLAAQQEQGTELVLHSADRAQAVLERFNKEWEFLIEDNPVTREGGVLRLAQPDAPVVALLAAEAFRLGFADAWRLPEDEDDFDIAALAGLQRPTRGEPILLGTQGRAYYLSDMRGLGENVVARLEETDAALGALGFTHLGDIICTSLGDIVIRGYAMPAGDTWAVLIQGTFGPDTFDFVTRFEKGAALTTTRSRWAKDRPDRKDFKSVYPKADVTTLHAHHERRKVELAATYGRSLPVAPELIALARAIDEALQRDAI